MKIAKRDIMFFIFGLLTFFIIETIMDWNHQRKLIDIDNQYMKDNSKIE